MKKFIDAEEVDVEKSEQSRFNLANKRTADAPENQ